MNKQDLKFEVIRLYDQFLMHTEKKGISYGELNYIDSLTLKQLNKFYEELVNRGEF